MSVIFLVFPSWANANIIGKVLCCAQLWVKSSAGLIHLGSALAEGPMSEVAKAWENVRTWRVERRRWEMSWWSFHQRKRARSDSKKNYQNVGSCFSKRCQDVYLLYSTQRDEPCLNIIKGGKDSKAFQNSFLIFFIAENKVLLCFFSVQY